MKDVLLMLPMVGIVAGLYLIFWQPWAAGVVLVLAGLLALALILMEVTK